MLLYLGLLVPTTTCALSTYTQLVHTCTKSMEEGTNTIMPKHMHMTTHTHTFRLRTHLPCKRPRVGHCQLALFQLFTPWDWFSHRPNMEGTHTYPNGTALLHTHTHTDTDTHTKVHSRSKSISLMWSQGGQCSSQRDIKQHIYGHYGDHRHCVCV